MTDTSASPIKFTVSREKLLEGLNAVAPALASKTTLPILGNILLRSTDKGVQLSGTDLDLAIHVEVSADVEVQGALTVPAKRLLAIAKELPPSPVRVSNGKQIVKLECGQSRYNLHSLPDWEFPKFPEVDFRGSIRIAAGDLQALARQTSFSASDQESRPTLNGVLFQLDGETLRLVATDGHRLALAERQVGPTGMPFKDVIIPTRALAQVVRLFSAEDVLEIAQGDNHLGVRSGTNCIVTRLIEGPYPEYRNVIPTKHSREIRADRLAFLSAARRLVPVAADSTHRIVLSISTGQIELRARTADVGDGHDKIPVRFEGEPLETAMDASYLLDALDAIDSDEVRFLGSSSNAAFVIKPIEPKNRLLYLLMPQRVVD